MISEYKPIKKLNPESVSKIAAGQVVDRPVSILKELLENSLDAAATEITVRLSEGGLQKIVVTDNGIGIQAQDILLAVASHATSKIREASDLKKLVSYGFRGEALASIFTVAVLELQSRTADAEHGTKIISNSTETQPVGMSIGTTVIVSELFSHHPARRKFVRTPGYEYKLCLQLIEKIALTHPEVSLRVFHNEKLVLECRSETLLERILSIWGSEYNNQLLELNMNLGMYKLSGFIAKPQRATHHGHHQLILINRRIVSHPRISQQIKESFRSLLAAKKYPSFVFELTAPPELIDVNVDPQKTTVRLAEEEAVSKMIDHSIKSLLRQHNLQFGVTTAVEYPYQMDFGIGKYLAQKTELWSLKDIEKGEILQIDNLYLVVENECGLLLIDQHAAHERILYDQLIRQLEKEKIDAQSVPLSEPVVISASASEVLILEQNAELLTKLGFVVQSKDNNTLFVQAVPKYLQKSTITSLFTELLQNLDTGTRTLEVSETIHRTVAYVACRSAIKAGEPLTKIERYNLVQKLKELPDVYTCPHGRPVSVTIGLKELAKLFERI